MLVQAHQVTSVCILLLATVIMLLQGLTLEHKARILRRYNPEVPRAEAMQLLLENDENLDLASSILYTSKEVAALRVSPCLHELSSQTV